MTSSFSVVSATRCYSMSVVFLQRSRIFVPTTSTLGPLLLAALGPRRVLSADTSDALIFKHVIKDRATGQVILRDEMTACGRAFLLLNEQGDAFSVGSEATVLVGEPTSEDAVAHTFAGHAAVQG